MLLTLYEEQFMFIVKKGGRQMQAYCFKCKVKREVRNAQSVVMKNGKPATRGTCAVCGTRMFTIGKAKD